MLATGSIIIRAPAHDVFRAVSDPLTYPLFDPKVTLMETVSGNGSEARLLVNSYVLFPFLEAIWTLRARLEPYESIEMTSEAAPTAFPARLFIEQFSAQFSFEEAGPGATRVLHTESYVTKRTVLGRLLGLVGQRWLRRQMNDVKLPRLKELIERGTPNRRTGTDG